MQSLPHNLASYNSQLPCKLAIFRCHNFLRNLVWDSIFSSDCSQSQGASFELLQAFLERYQYGPSEAVSSRGVKNVLSDLSELLLGPLGHSLGHVLSELVSQWPSLVAGHHGQTQWVSESVSQWVKWVREYASKRVHPWRSYEHDLYDFTTILAKWYRPARGRCRRSARTHQTTHTILFE